MSYLTHQLEMLAIVEKSQLEPKERELLVSSINRETPWTEEIDQLMDKAIEQTEQ